MSRPRAARDEPDLSARVDRLAARFGERYRGRAALTRDRQLSEELTLQTTPLLQSVLEALGFGGSAREASGCESAGPQGAGPERAGLEAAGPERGGPRGAPTELELREVFALGSLLGRRVADLGGTPSAALHVAPALAEALQSEAALGDEAWPERATERLRQVLMEGYVAAREDALAHEGAVRAAEAMALVELAPRCFVWLPRGDQDADQLEAQAEAVGRRLLERDARALVVHAEGLRRPDRERARQLFGVRVSCAMLGVRCLFSGVPEPWLDAARAAELDLAELSLAARWSDALEQALDLCGYRLGPRALEGLWRRLRRR